MIPNRRLKAIYWSLIVVYFVILIIRGEDPRLYILLATIFTLEAADWITYLWSKRKREK